MSHESLVMESGTHSSLHPNCYHQITYAKFSFKIHYLQPYKPKIWHYDQVSADHFRKEVDLFPWEKSLRNFNTSNVTFYLTRRLRIFFLIVFLMKQLHLMIDIIRGLTRKWNS